MRAIRSRLLALCLTLAVSLGLASQAIAHPPPTAGELELQMIRALGLPVGSLCGDAAAGKDAGRVSGGGAGHAPAPCPGASCGPCAAPVAAEAAALWQPALPAGRDARFVPALATALVLPVAERPCPPAHGPPARA